MYHSVLACTPANYFAMYGIIYGILFLWCLHKYGENFTNKKIYKNMIFVAVLVSLISEHYVNYPILNVFILMASDKLFTRCIGNNA